MGVSARIGNERVNCLARNTIQFEAKAQRKEKKKTLQIENMEQIKWQTSIRMHN